MKPEVMEQLRDASDLYSLTKGVLELCEPYGPVHSFRFIHNRGAERVACFIELESAKQQPALARALGARTSAGCCFCDSSSIKHTTRAAPRLCTSLKLCTAP